MIKKIKNWFLDEENEDFVVELSTFPFFIWFLYQLMWCEHKGISYSVCAFITCLFIFSFAVILVLMGIFIKNILIKRKEKNNVRMDNNSDS